MRLTESRVLRSERQAENVLYVSPESRLIKLIDYNCSRTVQPPRADALVAAAPAACRERRASTSAIDAPAAGEAGRHHKRSRSLVGTPAYFSPELLSEHESGKTSDMWAIGCIVCLLLSGSLPFSGRDKLDLQRAILHAEVDFAADEHWAPLSYGAKHFTKSLLQKDPLQRLRADRANEHFWLSKVPLVPTAIQIPNRAAPREGRGAEAPAALSVSTATSVSPHEVALSSPRRLRKETSGDLSERMGSANALVRERDAEVISEHVKKSSQNDLTQLA